MINLRHIKFLVIIIFSLLISTQSFADKRFEKDLKKVSKDNTFINSKGEAYSLEETLDKRNTLLIVYNHGSGNDQTLDKCSKKWNKVPPIILNLHDKKIKDHKVRIYHLCSGVRGWSQNHQDKLNERYKNKKKEFFRYN